MGTSAEVLHLNKLSRLLTGLLLFLGLAWALYAVPAPAAPGHGQRPHVGPVAQNDDDDDDEDEGTGAELPTAEEVRNAPKALDPKETDDDNESSDEPAQFTLSPLPPVINQANLNSCGACSFGYALTSFLVNKANHTDPTDPNNEVSPAFMYHVALINYGASGCSYTRASNYFDALVKNGAASWAEAPYPTGRKLDCSLIQEVDTDFKPAHKKFRLGSWDQLEDGSDVDEIKEFLRDGQPVVGLYQLYKSISKLQNNVWILSGAKSGSHFMTVVGYDDNMEYTDAEGNAHKGALKVMNSWGTRYGDHGFVWIPYATHQETCKYAYTAEAIENKPPSESGGGLSPGQGELTGQVTRAYQAVAQRHVDLIIAYQFSDPVTINSVRVTSPSGKALAERGHVYAAQSGDVYFRRSDGKQFEAGTYKVEFHVTTLDKTAEVLTGTCKVAARGTFPQAPPVAAVSQ